MHDSGGNYLDTHRLPEGDLCAFCGESRNVLGGSYAPEQLRVEEALERSGLFSAKKISEFEVDNDDLKDMGVDDEPWDPQDTSWERMTGGATEGCDWYQS